MLPENLHEASNEERLVDEDNGGSKPLVTPAWLRLKLLYYYYSSYDYDYE